jgi:hypothetical protein
MKSFPPGTPAITRAGVEGGATTVCRWRRGLIRTTAPVSDRNASHSHHRASLSAIGLIPSALRLLGDAAIAKTLNAEKISPPRVFAKNRRVGWKASTIRAMLHNESYVGRWRYRSSQWRKVPGTNAASRFATTVPMRSLANARSS